MRRHLKRQFFPRVDLLEARCLLSVTPTATWIGQDGHDYAGGATPGSGNGIQDVHIVLAGLPANDPISKIQMLGYGAGEWDYNAASYSQYGGVLFQSTGATSADWYIDVYQNETGRPFTLTITYADQTSSVINMQGGSASMNLYMPVDTVAVQWHGQDGQDYTGQSVDVGPDGFQDVHLSLTQLYAPTAINAVIVTDPLGDAWGAGSNPDAYYRAEFIRNSNDATQGDLYFSPNRDLYGQVLTVTVDYADGTTSQSTVTAGHTNPTLAMPAQATVSVTWGTLSAQWLGQDGFTLIGPGDVHLALAGIPSGRTVASATLSDQTDDDWSYSSTADPSAMRLGFHIGTNATQANLAFPPVVDETGATLTLLVTLDNGTVLATHLAGGSCDPGLREPGIAPTTIVAHPGDDLNALANSYGTVRLVAGLYVMNAPLVLNNPVTITAEPGTTILFSQAANAPTWDTAITVRASHTTLNGFAVRFAGPVRWTANVSYGDAVIGWNDNFDAWTADPGIDLTFSNLDIQAPPAASSWEVAPSAFRLVGAESGQVSTNRIKGGTTEMIGGPWQIVNNDYVGTMPDTYTYCAFATHSTRDLTLSGNTVEPSGPSGKTWRFLVMTQGGVNDLVASNTVVGVGPMDSDTIPSPNANEVILTEDYDLHYEGMVSSVSSDGYTLQISMPQGGQARTGDVVAILSGPQAGQFRTIAQVINPTTYVLNNPITPGTFAVSLETGFVDETFQGNTEDCRGSTTAEDLVLVGNQFGLKVVNNTFLGGASAFKITAAPSESPMMWGWSHAPLLGATITGNTFQDSVQGGLLDVEHASSVASDAGRVYFSGTFSNNTGVWTPAFLAAEAAAGTPVTPVLVTVGDSLSVDPGDLVLTASGNQVSGPASVLASQTFLVNSATLNGLKVTRTATVLPAVGSSSNPPTTTTPAVVLSIAKVASSTTISVAKVVTPSAVAKAVTSTPEAKVVTPSPVATVSTLVVTIPPKTKTPAPPPKPPTPVPPSGPTAKVRPLSAGQSLILSPKAKAQFWPDLLRPGL